jgi:hypothetical protein
LAMMVTIPILHFVPPAPATELLGQPPRRSSELCCC